MARKGGIALHSRRVDKKTIRKVGEICRKNMENGIKKF